MEVKAVEVSLILARSDQNRPFNFRFSRMINAGFVGRNQEEVQRHIQELEKKGIHGPRKTPVLYPVACRTLTTDSDIEVYGFETSGEVEYVLLVENEEKIYIGIGSDHTDRNLEGISIPRSKQICPNLIGKTVWPLSEVEDHWDALQLQCTVTKNGKDILYQKGALELIWDPKALIEIVKSSIPGPIRETVVFSGTIGMSTEGFIYGDRFTCSLIDAVLDRRLELAYDVRPLNYLPME